MTDHSSNTESFFDYDFYQGRVNEGQHYQDETESDYDELNQHQIYFEKRKPLKPLTEKLRKWRKNIRSSVGRLRELRGSSASEDGSRPTSALSINSSSLGGSGRSSPMLEVVDFIDDEYLAIRRRVCLYHLHLRRVFEHLDNALKRGPPLAGRLDALKTTFKSGPVGLFPEEELAKCLSDFCLDLANDGKLALSLRDASDAFNSSACHRQALVKTARGGFLAPLTEFLSRDWKEICTKDKSLRQLAKKIQKAKTEGKHSQTEINELMARFTVRRRDVVTNFNYILKSEIPLTKRLINLVEAYKIYHFENTKVFNELERSLRVHLGQTPPEIITFGGDQVDETASLPETDSSSSAAIESQPQTDATEKEVAKPTSNELEGDREEGKREMIGDSGGTPGGVTLANLSLTGGGDLNSFAAKQFLWKEKNLKPIPKSTPSLPGYRAASRAYGFVRSDYSASGGDELSLSVGDCVYLDAKLQHEETKEIWVCGEVSSGLDRKSGIFPLSVVEIIIDL